MEQKGSLPCSEEPTIGPSRDSNEFQPTLCYLISNPFSIITLSMYEKDNHRRTIHWQQIDS
jgi:hypothetical protein